MKWQFRLNYCIRWKPLYNKKSGILLSQSLCYFEICKKRAIQTEDKPIFQRKKILSSANFNFNFSYLRAKRALNEIFRRDKSA